MNPLPPPEPERVVLGICTCQDPDHVHDIVDEHPQDDLVFDGLCPDCRSPVEIGECISCGKHVHEHYELYPPSDGSHGVACPVCTVGIDRILVCTMRDESVLMPCQHELDLEKVFS